MRKCVRLVRLGTLTNLTFFIVLQFEIFLRLDNFSSSFLFQKYHLELKNDIFENHDILFYSENSLPRKPRRGLWSKHLVFTYIFTTSTYFNHNLSRTADIFHFWCFYSATWWIILALKIKNRPRLSNGRSKT